MNARFPSFYRHSDAQKLAVENVTKSMRTRLGNDPELCGKLIPKFPLGCRRVTPGHGYLEALTAGNVVVETSHIARITEGGVMTVDGKLHEVDIIVTATGYITSFVPRFPIVGLGGRDLQQEWADKKGAQGYLSVTAPAMPNYFCKSVPSLALATELCSLCC
jgi:cation diffusion facilitator CzcD-associated flavoprotein CzcO